MWSVRISMSIIVIALLSVSCTDRKEGTIAGTVSPASTGARVSALQSGAIVASQEADSKTGAFRLTLPPGVYDVQIRAEGRPYPITLSNIVVESGKTADLDTVELPPIASGSVSIAGRVISPSGARVALIYDGVERAGLNADNEGRYEFSGLPAGRYTLQVSAPGYAAEQREIELAENGSAAGDIILLYISDIPGIDWSTGRISVTGTGMPPEEAANATIGREMARLAAIADGQRRLLAAIERIKTGPNTELRSLFKQKEAVVKIQGFVQGYRVVSERQLDDGRIEIDMELPITGMNGLSSTLAEMKR